jgi:integrase
MTPCPLDPTCNPIAIYTPPPGCFPSLQDLSGGLNVITASLSPEVYTIMQICFVYFARIAEILDIVVGDILPADRVIIHGHKKSRSYIIFLPQIYSQFAPYLTSNPTTPIFYPSYSMVYRQCIRSGIVAHPSAKSNRSVTHLARYIVATSASYTLDIGTVQDIMRHRSASSTRHYINTQRA